MLARFRVSLILSEVQPKGHGPRIWWLLVMGILGVSTSTLWIRLSDSDELQLAFRRLALASVVLWWLAWRGRGEHPLARSGRAIWISGACLAIHFGSWMASLHHLSVATSVVLVYVHPAVVYAIEVMRKQARADGIRLAGVLVTLVGTGIFAAAAGEGQLGVGAGDPTRNPTLGVLLALIGSFSFVGYIFAGRTAIRELPVSVYTSRSYSVAALLLAVYLIGQGALSDGVGVIWPEDGKEWLLAGCLALFPTLLGHTPLNAALRHFPPSVVSTAFLGEVALAPLLVWLWLGETPPAAFWSGGPLVVLGIATVAWRGALEKSNSSD